MENTNNNRKNRDADSDGARARARSPARAHTFVHLLQFLFHLKLNLKRWARFCNLMIVNRFDVFFSLLSVSIVIISRHQCRWQWSVECRWTWNIFIHFGAARSLLRKLFRNTHATGHFWPQSRSPICYKWKMKNTVVSDMRQRKRTNRLFSVAADWRRVSVVVYFRWKKWTCARPHAATTTNNRMKLIDRCWVVYLSSRVHPFTLIYSQRKNAGPQYHLERYNRLVIVDTNVLFARNVTFIVQTPQNDKIHRENALIDRNLTCPLLLPLPPPITFQ